jgi:hypothetical protein
MNATPREGQDTRFKASPSSCISTHRIDKRLIRPLISSGVLLQCTVFLTRYNTPSFSLNSPTLYLTGLCSLPRCPKHSCAILLWPINISALCFSLHLFISSSLHLFISSSLHLFISSSLHLFISSSLYLFR